MNIKTTSTTLASAALVYLLLLLRLGYQFGGGDQVEVLPLALYLEDPSLYPHDIYLQSAAQVWPNERWLLVQWVRLVPPDYYYGWCLLWHGLFSLLLLVGAQRVAGLFIRDERLAWLAVILNFVVFYYFAPGGNELYAPALVGSLAAKAIAIWAVYWFFRGHLLRAIALLIPATWFQPLVGLHLAAVFFAVQGFELWRERRGGWQPFLGALALYALFGASWAVYLKLKTAAAGQGVPLADADFYDILFYFRSAF